MKDSAYILHKDNETIDKFQTMNNLCLVLVVYVAIDQRAFCGILLPILSESTVRCLLLAPSLYHVFVKSQDQFDYASSNTMISIVAKIF
jgi:hypothetical protein